MMYIEAALKYKEHFEGEYRYQSIELPYGKNNHLVMNIVLPGHNEDLSQLLQVLSEQNSSTWFDELEEPELGVMLWLPKFRFEVDLDLKQILKTAGLEQIFDEEKANLSKMLSFEESDNLTPESLAHVSKVQQKIWLEISEAGTETAVTTKAEVGCSWGPCPNEPPPKPIEMRINRPFFFVIRDTRSDALLFMGQVYDPAT